MATRDDVVVTDRHLAQEQGANAALTKPSRQSSPQEPQLRCMSPQSYKIRFKTWDRPEPVARLSWVRAPGNAPCALPHRTLLHAL
jgi:hypothetical protein